MDDFITIEEDQDSFPVDVLDNDIEVDGDPRALISATVVGGSEQGEARVESNRVFFDPALNFNGDVEVLYVFSDGELETTATLFVTVNPVNDVPTGVDDSLSIEEDQDEILIDVLANDIDDDSLALVSFTFEGGSEQGEVRIEGNNLFFEPALNFNGNVQIDYVLSDGELEDTATLVITVNPVNDAPVGVDDFITINEDQDAFPIDVLDNDIEVDNDGRTLVSASVVGGAGQGEASIAGNRVFFQPALNFNGNAEVVYIFSDGELEGTATLFVTVNPVNDAPIGVDDFVTIQEDQAAFPIDVLDNDIELESDPRILVGVRVSGGSNQGVAFIEANRVFFQPAQDFFGSVEIEYDISDGNLQGTGNLFVTVVPVDDLPSTQADNFNVDGDGPQQLDVLSNDIDVDSPLSLVSAEIISGNGSVAVNGGVLSFTPGSSDNVLIEYTISDGENNFTALAAVNLVTVGTIPIGEIGGIQEIEFLPEILSVLPMSLIDFSESEDEVDGLTRYALTGDATVNMPEGLTIPGFQLHGAEILVYAEHGGEADLNSFFVKLSLYNLLENSFSIPNVPVQISDFIPNIPVIIGFSDRNMDENPIENLPEPVQDFFDGVFDLQFGVPIFTDTRDFNLFLAGLGVDVIPDILTLPFDAIGIDRQFIEQNLGVAGRLTLQVQVRNVGTLIDALSLFLDVAGNEELRPSNIDIGSISLPSVAFGFIFPSLSLPAFLNAGFETNPLFSSAGAGAQFSYSVALSSVDLDFNAAEVEEIGLEIVAIGDLMLNLPNLINADSLQDEPGAEPLFARGVLQNSITFDAQDITAEGAIDFTLSLRRELREPFGIPGISIDNAAFTVGGGVALSATGLGAGLEVRLGLGGELSCLSEEGEVIGTGLAAGAITIFPGASARPIRGFGLAADLPGMTVVDAYRCATSVQNGVIFGMADTLVSQIPIPEAQDLLRTLIDGASGDAEARLNADIAAVRAFPPTSIIFDQLRFTNTNLLVVTPDVELEGFFDGNGALALGGEAEFRATPTSPFESIGQVQFSANLGGGLQGSFDIPDINIENLIVLEDVSANLDLQLSPVTAEFQLSGSQVLGGLNSETDVDVSLENGIRVNSRTAIDNLAMMTIDARSVGEFATWPPLGTLDLVATANLELDTGEINDVLHGAVSSITGDASNAYREALSVLQNQSREETALRNEIERIEREVRERTDAVSRGPLRNLFNIARNLLDRAESALDYNIFQRDRHIRFFDDLFWLDPRRAYHATRIGVHALAIEGIEEAIPALRNGLDEAESRLNDAIRNVAQGLEPRLVALRTSLVFVQGARNLAIIAVSGFEAANNAVQDISNALRDASNFRVNRASAEIQSLAGFLFGVRDAEIDLDVELPSVGLRCQSMLDFNLVTPVESIIEGVGSIFGGCVNGARDTASNSASLSVEEESFSFFDFFRSNEVLQGGDTAADAVLIDDSLPVTIEANNANASTAVDEFVDGGQTNTVWWRWIPESSDHYRLSTTGGDTSLQVHDANANNPGTIDSLIAADLRPAIAGELVLFLEAGTEYLISVATQFSEPGEIELSIEAIDLPEVSDNDNFANARDISFLSGVDVAANYAATTEVGEFSEDSLPIQNTLWWSFTAPNEGLYTFDTLGSEIDTILRAYKHLPQFSGLNIELPSIAGANVANVPWLKTSDDLGASTEASLRLRLYAGETIWLSAGGKYPNFGDVILSWGRQDGSPDELIGDLQEAPIVLDSSESSIVLTNLGATTEIDEPLHGGGVANHASIWLQFSPTQAGTYILDTFGSDIDTLLSIYDVQNLDQELAGNNDLSLNNLTSRLRVELQANQDYLIAIAGNDEAEGEIVFNYLLDDLNDAFSDRLTLTENGTLVADITDATLEANEPDYELILASDQSPDALLAGLGDAVTEIFSDDELLEFEAQIQAIFDSNLTQLQQESITGSLWWSYVPSQNGDLFISAQQTGVENELDTALFVFEGNPSSGLASLQEIAWNDNHLGELGSEVRASLNQGTEYFIALTSRESGQIDLSWELVPLADQNVENDVIDNAISVNINSDSFGQLSGDNTYARNDLTEEDSAFELPVELSLGQSGKRLWWSFVIEQDGYLSLITDQSEVDPVIEVYQVSSAGELLIETLNDNYRPDSNSSRVLVPISVGSEVFVAVDSFDEETGIINLNYAYNQVASVPANDRLDQPLPIATSTTSLVVNTDFAQYQIDEPAMSSLVRPNMIWYEWIAESSGSLQVATSGANFDTAIAVFQQAGEDLSRLAFNDDRTDEDTSSLVDVFVEQGERYLIGLAGRNGVQGEVTLELDFQPVSEIPGLSTNTNIADNLEIVAGIASGVLVHTTSDPDTGSDLVLSNPENATSLWWRWNAPESGPYLLDTTGSDFVPIMEVYRGETQDNIVLIAESAGDGDATRVPFEAEAGANYFIRMTSAFMNQGDFTFVIEAFGGEVLPQNILVGESDSVPAAVDSAGVHIWTWTAPRDGNILFALDENLAQDNSFDVFEIVNGVPTLITAAEEHISGNSDLNVVFAAEEGVTYEIRLTTSQALLGNSFLSFNYLGAAEPAVDTESESIAIEIEQTQQLLTRFYDDIDSGLLDVEQVRTEILESLETLVTESGSDFESVELAISTDIDLDGDWISIELIDEAAGTVLISLAIDTAADNPASNFRYRQVSIGDSDFEIIEFDQTEGNPSVGINVPFDAFEESLFQSFVSVVQRSVDIPEQLSQFQEDFLYDIELVIYSNTLRELPLGSDEVPATQGVSVRLPVDSDALLTWLNRPELTTEEAEAEIRLAFQQDLLQVITANDVAALVADQGVAIRFNDSVAVNLAESYVEFRVEHFSAFAVVAEGSSEEIEIVDPIDPEPDTVNGSSGGIFGGCSVGTISAGSANGIDPTLPALVFISLFYLFRKRYGSLSRIKQ